MTQILKNSDFVLKVSFIDIFGRSINVKQFELFYSTSLSLSVVAKFDGTEYSSNCTPVEDGVLITFNTPNFDAEQLKVRRKIELESPYFKDGVRHIDQVEMLPFHIVKSYSTNPQVMAPRTITSSQQDLVLIETLVVEAFVGPKGEQGIPGTPAIDYSVEQEHLIKGEFWVGADGLRRQVYGQCFRDVFPAPVIDGKTMVVGLTYQKSSILISNGFFVNSINGDVLQLNEGSIYIRGEDGALIFSKTWGSAQEAQSFIGKPYGIYCKYTNR